MLSEAHRGYQIAGEITPAGYRLTVTTPTGVQSTAIYPTLCCDMEARGFAHRLIAHLAAGYSLHLTTPARRTTDSRQLPTPDDTELHHG